LTRWNSFPLRAGRPAQGVVSGSPALHVPRYALDSGKTRLIRIGRSQRSAQQRAHAQLVHGRVRAESHYFLFQVSTKGGTISGGTAERGIREVEGVFKFALDLDPKSIQALIEYGWYKLNVLDDASGALELFRRAQHPLVDFRDSNGPIKMHGGDIAKHFSSRCIFRASFRSR
jgi:hypothetical protein